MPIVAGLFAIAMAQAAITDSLVAVPGGQIEAIWLSPVSKKIPSMKAGGSGAPLVPVEAFSAQSHAITVEQFNAFLRENPRWEKKNVSALFADERYLSDLPKDAHSKAPVTNVSWYAARAYCQSRGLRLPTVNEWEYLAAASESTANANREPAFLQRILDWYGEPQGGALKPVGSIYKNKYGLWDMHGLIWEWVEDFNSSFVTGESREDGSLNKDMFCGAGAMSSADKENYAAFMRFAFRSGLKGRSAVWNLGFRCVK